MATRPGSGAPSPATRASGQPPGSYLFVVTGKQNLRHHAALPVGWPRIMGIFQQSPFEALFPGGLLVAHDARQQPDHGIDKSQRRRLTAGQHEIAEADLFNPMRFQDPFIHPFVTPAEQGHDRIGGKLPDESLIEQPATLRQVDHTATP